MPDLSKLSERKLRELIDKRSAVVSARTSDLINAGRGNERCSDTRTKAEEGDDLAIAWRTASDAFYEAIEEEQARLRYQGNRKPIKRAYA